MILWSRPAGKLLSRSIVAGSRRRRKRVRAGGLRKDDNHGGLPVHITVGGVIERPSRPRHIAKPRKPAIVVGLDHDFPELLGLRQPAWRNWERGLKGFVRCHRRLAQRPRPRPGCFAPVARSTTSVGGHAERRNLGRIEPSPHRIFALRRTGGLSPTPFRRESGSRDLEQRVVPTDRADRSCYPARSYARP